jgi:hypothetical protein
MIPALDKLSYRHVRDRMIVGSTYSLERLKPRASKFRGPRCIIFLTLLLDFHTYAVITYYTF